MPTSILLPLLFGTLGCAAKRAPDKTSDDALVGELEREFLVPGYDDRNYLLHLPPSYDGNGEIPVVLALHGGGGNGEGTKRLTCLDGRRHSGTCITDLADDEGFAVVFPNGIGSKVFPDHRSWNAGGGKDGWRCTGGRACEENLDDVAYIDAVLEELDRALYVDDKRIYSTGMSNGGAMSHRLACERSEVFAAIASVGGVNQAQTVQGCEPSRAISVLQIHGDEDPCWPYEGGTFQCLRGGDEKGDFISAPASLEGWVTRNGCAADTHTDTTADPERDGTSESQQTWTACDDDAVVSMITVHGGGHTWPQGWSYLDEDTIGLTSQDFSANEAIWDFFVAHPLP